MIRSFRSRALKPFRHGDDASGLRPDWIKRINLIITALEGATEPSDLDLPGLKFHALSGDLSGRYAVLVSRNWRITFGWDHPDATDVDLEDYHGR